MATSSPFSDLPTAEQRATAIGLRQLLWTSPGGTLLANLRVVGLGDLLGPGVRSGAHRTPEAVNDDDVATVRPCGPNGDRAGRASGVPEGMAGDPDP